MCQGYWLEVGNLQKVSSKKQKVFLDNHFKKIEDDNADTIQRDLMQPAIGTLNQNIFYRFIS